MKLNNYFQVRKRRLKKVLIIPSHRSYGYGLDISHSDTVVITTIAETNYRSYGYGLDISFLTLLSLLQLLKLIYWMMADIIHSKWEQQLMLFTYLTVLCHQLLITTHTKWLETWKTHMILVTIIWVILFVVFKLLQIKNMFQPTQSCKGKLHICRL
jgi:uncharacterized membrane protein